MNPSASEQLLFEAACAPFEGWSLLQVTGRHRLRYLQSQLTSDVESLAPGESQLSALLDASGRLQSFFYLQVAEDAVRVLVPDEIVETTLSGLRERVIADDVELVQLDTGPMRIVLGPAVAELIHSLPPESVFPILGYGAQTMVEWSGVALDLPTIPPDELEERRVLSGVPAWGREVSPGQLINETTLLDLAVSFTKGCYLGQETVAKVASRRGAAYATMVLVTESAPEDVNGLVGEWLATAERAKSGQVLAVVPRDGTTNILVRLWRDLRVAGKQLNFEGPGGQKISARVAPMPLMRTPDAREQGDLLFHRAVALFNDDRESEAMALLKRTVAVCPDYADAYESMGVILGREGRFEEAIEWMDRLLEVDPDSVMAHTNKSVYLNQLGRNEEAEDEARMAAVKGLERDRRHADRQAEERNRTDAEAADRRRREDMFQQVLELDPEDTLANFGLGQLRLETADFDAAVSHLQTALQADPDYSAAYLALGRAYEGLDESNHARETFLKGVEVAARRGDMKTANEMQERLAALTNT